MIKTDRLFERFNEIFFISAMLGSAVSYSKVYLFHLVFFFLFILIISKYKHILTQRKTSKLHYFFYFLCAWYTLSLLWSINYTYSLKYLFYICIGSAVSVYTVLYLDSIQKIKKMISLCGIVLSIEIVFALLESFTTFRLPVSPFSHFAELFGRQNSLYLFTELELMSIMITPTGFRWNPNNLGIIMVILLPFVIFHENFRFKHLFVFLIFIVIILSGSRLSIISSVLLLLIYLFRINIRMFFIGLSFMLVSGVIISNTYTLLNANPYGKKITDIADIYISVYDFFSAEDKIAENKSMKSLGSSNSRRILLQNGWNAFVDSNGLGVGGGGSIAVQEKHNIHDEDILKSMHNFWFEMLVDGGIILLGMFIFWYTTLIIRMKRVWNTSNVKELRYLSMSSFFALLLFLLTAMSASSVVYFLPMWLLFGITIAIYNCFKNEKTETPVVS